MVQVLTPILRQFKAREAVNASETIVTEANLEAGLCGDDVGICADDDDVAEASRRSSQWVTMAASITIDADPFETLPISTMQATIGRSHFDPPSELCSLPSRGSIAIFSPGASNTSRVVPPAKFFLCHKQSNGQDAVMTLRLLLAERIPGAAFWVDVEQNPTANGMQEGVKSCTDFVLFCTQGVTESQWCQMEMSWALQNKKNIIIVTETDDRHGRPDFTQLINNAPSDLQDIFTKNVAIPWYRDSEFREVSLEKICRACVAERVRRRARSPTSRYAHIRDIFDDAFLWFTAIWGVPLPGVSKPTDYWTICVRILTLVCSVLCFTRMFQTNGPAFVDQRQIVEIVVTHYVILFFCQMTLKTLGSDLVADMVENHIDCKHYAQDLRSRTRLLTGVASVLTAVYTMWGWLAYLPGFFDPYYVAARGNNADSKMLFGVTHGTVWIFFLPVFFGNFFSALLIIHVIQELAFMDLCTAFHSLHPRIARKGIHVISQGNEALSIRKEDLVDFQRHYVSAWHRYRKVNRMISWPFVAFWIMQVALLPWSIWNICKGFNNPTGDALGAKINSHWYLIVRESFFVGGAFWSGFACWLTGMLPFFFNIYASRMREYHSALLFTQPELKTHLTIFVERFDLSFTHTVMQGKLKLIPMYAAVLAVNSLGAVSDAMRLLNHVA
jgi:hypothetical protein